MRDIWRYMGVYGGIWGIWMGVWVYGCMGVWVYGYMGVCSCSSSVQSNCPLRKTEREGIGYSHNSKIKFNGDNSAF